MSRPMVELKPLPHGRHGLSREEVEASQRYRLAKAMADAMAEKGYARTTVADIISRARVSRETFYTLFRSKEDCFMHAFEEAYRHVFDAAANRLAGGGQGLVRVDARELLDQVLRDYLEVLTAEPQTARVFLIEVYAAGGPALARRRELMGDLVAGLAAYLGLASDEERFALEAYLAAVVQLVTTRLAADDPQGVRELHGPLVALAERMLLARA